MADIKSIIVTKGIADELRRVPSCIKVELNGAPYDPKTNAYTTIDVTQTTTFKIASECTQEARMAIQTDLASSWVQFILDADTNKEITLNPAQTVITKNGMLGAYPVGVSAIVGTNVFVENFDVIVKDNSSCFDLNEAIYDLQSVEKVAGTITNKVKDQTVSQIVIDKTEVNIPVNDSLFVKPAVKK